MSFRDSFNNDMGKLLEVVMGISERSEFLFWLTEI